MIAVANRFSLPMGVDVVIRLHDHARLLEFDRALFSLASQSFSPVHPIVVTQGFDETMTAAAAAVIDAFNWQEGEHCTPTIIDVANPARKDLRAQLLNAGISRARHRFVAFLDFDDYLYEDAYQYLVGQAMITGAAITFGGIVCRQVRVFDRFVYASKAVEGPFFPGKDAADLMIDSFCPIHSFVIDREQIAPEDLQFTPDLQRFEDYDFLLRFCMKYSSHFESRAKPIGVYNFHLDGRATTQRLGISPERIAADRRAWDEAQLHIQKLKMRLGLPTKGDD